MVSMVKKYKTLFLTIVWTYISLFGLVYYLKIGMDNRNYSNNMIYAILFPLIFMMIRKAGKYVDKKKILYSVPLAVFTSCVFVLGAQIEYWNALSWTILTVVRILALSALLVPVYLLVFHLCLDYQIKPLEWNTDNWKKWKIYLLIVFFWVLAYLALFPGVYDYDSIAQTLQFLVTGQLSGHHPVVHSFLLSSFLQIGKLLFGSYELGLGIYSLLQLLFLAYAAMSVSWYLLKKRCNRLFIFSLVFYALFPVHYIMAVWATKDTIFTGLFVLISLSLIEMADEESSFWDKKRNMVRFVVLTVLMCMFRNNGIYALILMLPVCLFCFKRGRWKVITLVAVSAVLYLSYQNVLLPAIGVVPGNMREMMSIPCQQLAKVYVETPEVFTEEEKETLFELIPEENLMGYSATPMIADTTKNFFDSDVFKSDPAKYAKLYIDIGLKSPRKYIEAFLANSLGFWYPNKSYPDSRMFHPYMEFDMADPNLFKGDYIYLERISLFPQYEFVLRILIQYTAWEYLPVISNFFVPGTYFFVLVFAIVITFYRKNYSQLLVMGLWAGLWFTMLISPVALIRYAYPVIMCLPLLGYLIILNKRL